jgi:hypothetical protein
MLFGSMTLSSSLPTCAVSPAETLRSVTMPSNGARTSVRPICWRASTTRALAASTSLCVMLRRPSASSSAWAEAMPEARSVFMRSNWRVAWSKASSAARLAASAELSASRMAVASRRTSASPLRTWSPFSRSTCITTACTSARRSARRSGWIDPVIEGPEVSAVLRTVCRSSGEISNAVAGAAAPFWAALGPLSQPARTRAKTKTGSQRNGMESP